MAKMTEEERQQLRREQHEASKKREQHFKELRENIAAEMLQKYPKLELDRRQYGIKAINYIPYYQDGIKVRKVEREINTKSFSMENQHLTKADAIAAITPVVPKAEEKYKQIVEAFNSLQSNMACHISYRMDGDTHGIYEDSLYVSFEMNGFDFQFDIAD